MNTLLKNWDFARIFRLVAGIIAGVYAITSEEYIFLLLAALFLFQAILNLSCCGSGCSSSGRNAPDQVYKDVIKPYKPKQK